MLKMACLLIHFLLTFACFPLASNCQILDTRNVLSLRDMLVVHEGRRSKGKDNIGVNHNYYKQTAIAISDVGTFLDVSFEEGLRLWNESLVLHAYLNRNETYAVLTKIGSFPPLIQVHLTISTNESGCEDFDLDSFLAKVKELLLSSNFYSQNPLLLDVVSNEGKLNCFIGYRVDVIHNYAVIKKVSGHSRVCNLQPGFGPASDKRPTASLANDLMGAKLIAAFVQDEETSFDTDVGWEVVDGIARFTVKGGYAPEILWALKRMLNFSIIPYQSEDWGFYHQTTKQWSGSIADVAAGNVDIAVSSAALSRSRASMVDFNIGTHYITIGVFFKSVRKNAAQLGYSLLAPFHPCLWAAICLWILINASIYFLFLKPSNNSKTRPKETKCDCTELRQCRPDTLTLVGNIISLSLNPLCQRGCNWIPSNFGLRCMYGFQLLTGFVLYSSYAGILVSFLSVEKVAINNLTDLASGKYPFRFGVVGFELTRQILDTCKCHEQERDLVKIFELMKVPGTTTNALIDYDDPWGEVKNGHFAYFTDDISAFAEIRTWKANESCSTQTLLISFSKQLQGTFVKKGSRMKKVIDYGLVKLMENGHVRRLRRIHLPTPVLCHQVKTFTEAGVVDMQMALHILLGSALLSVIILFLELTYTHLVLKYKLSKILRNGWVN